MRTGRFWARTAPVGRLTVIVALTALLEAVTAPALPAAPQAAPDTGSRISIEGPNQKPVSLYYEEHGAGTPVLLLHGLGESTFTWREILPALASRHRVVALDLKGFGYSDKPDDGAYSADDQAALVAQFIVKKNLTDLALVGHSFGGTVALRTALADGIAGSGRVKRLAVIAAPALPRTAARRLDLVMTPVIPDAMTAVLPPGAMARLLLREAMGGREPNESLVEGYAAPYHDQAAMRSFLATARSIISETDADAIAARYRKIRQPVLLAWCRKDPIVPLPSGRRLARTLPNQRFAVLEGCHHLPQHERPRQLIRTLTRFLDG